VGHDIVGHDIGLASIPYCPKLTPAPYLVLEEGLHLVGLDGVNQL
jgi:hypothetical protein